MGDIADMMLDGTLDFVTGEYMGDACGYPRTNDKTTKRALNKKLIKKIKCHYCERMIHPQGIEQHLKAKHNK